MNKRIPKLLLYACAALLTTACAPMQQAEPPIDAHIESTPANVVWGYIPPARDAVLRVRSGQTVRIDTLSHQPISGGQDPIKFFAAAGISPSPVLQQILAVFNSVQRPKDAGAHVLTGPIYVEGAEPGDMLEVRVLRVDFRVPYGVNNSNKGSGALPDLHQRPAPKVIHFDLKRRVALFAPGVEVPLNPFMGIMIVTPPEGRLLSSRPPGIYGGNLDMARLTAGSSLYLPVFQPGALFYTGDAHAVQGDGEVNGTAIETSLTPVFQFVVHKGAGKTMKWPRAEDASNYYVMGMDVDLNVAMREAAQESVNFLQREKNIPAGDAYALSSIATNFGISETVNHVRVIYGAIPKKIFSSNRPFWATGER
jgi:acetamidase/formamidase